MTNVRRSAHTAVLGVGMVALSALTGAVGSWAADQVVLGTRVVVKDPQGEKRIAVATAREKATEIGAPGQAGLDGDDPQLSGATLTVVVGGSTPTAQSFVLPAGAFDGPTIPGWKQTAVGFVYKDPKSLNGPVKVVVIKRTPGNVFHLRAVVKGTDPGVPGGLTVNLAPPNLGTDAGLVLDVDGGDRYCARWGGPAGGEIKKNDEKVFLVVGTRDVPTAQAGCAGAPATTTTTSASSSTTSSTSAALCGNGQPNPGETCDDGNQSDNDSCPSDCVVDPCSPLTGTVRSFDVIFNPDAGVNVGGITVLLDYPEGQVEIPGPPLPGGTITNLPAGAFPIVTDFDHTLRLIVAIGGGNSLVPGVLFRVNFRDCSGALPPTPASFACTVLEATDPFSNPLAPGDVGCDVVQP
jgi:cysteine-rich repeat protein